MSVEIDFQIAGLTVAADGYRWDWVEKKPAPVLLLRPKSNKTEQRPFTQLSALFRDFAALAHTPEAIAEFAGEHGNLRADADGVPHYEWVTEIDCVANLVRLWDAAETGETKGLLADTFGRPTKANDPVEAARQHVAKAVSDRISHLPASACVTTGQLTRLALTWPDLKTCLWWQFAAAVSGETKFRQCAVCGKNFELAPDANRTSRLYCRTACRMKAARGRIKVAKDMRSQGEPLKAIVAATGADLETVKKWTSNDGENDGKKKGADKA